MPEGNDIKAGRIFEINPNHHILQLYKKFMIKIKIKLKIMLHSYMIKHY